MRECICTLMSAFVRVRKFLHFLHVHACTWLCTCTRLQTLSTSQLDLPRNNLLHLSITKFCSPQWSASFHNQQLSASLYRWVCNWVDCAQALATALLVVWATQGRSFRGVFGGESPPNLKNMLFCREKMTVQCVFVGKLTGSRTMLSTTVTKT